MSESQSEPPQRQHTENTRITSAVESLKVHSGQILIIDQFMFANGQFDAALAVEGADNPPYSLGILQSVAKNYGGSIIELEKGNYIVERFLSDSVITISPEGSKEGSAIDKLSKNKDDFEIVGSVLIDTRCVALIDAEVACSKDNLDDYRKKRDKGGDKAGRDLIRNLGGAVRYGFNRLGDEFGIFFNSKENILALWPDVIESDEV